MACTIQSLPLRCMGSTKVLLGANVPPQLLKLSVRKGRQFLSPRLRVSAEVGTSSEGENGNKPSIRDPVEEYTGWNMDVNDTSALPQNYCLIESRDTVQDFAEMDIEEITKNMETRRTRIFLLMEEVRRLKIQQRVKTDNIGTEVQIRDDQYNSPYPSALPLLPPMTDESLDTYWAVFYLSIAAIILFGGIIAPTLELSMGLGGQSYAEFIKFLHLPDQLAAVDPFVASFTGGAVGVISSLMLIESNNVKQQALKRCGYCKGGGYLVCGSCSGSGQVVDMQSPTGSLTRCPTCSGTGKVMCTSCLCTGMALVTEHDPRIDPFD